MIDTDVREIRVGSIGADVWVRITDKEGADLTGIAVELRLTDPAGVVGDWFAPSPLTIDGSVARARFTHDATLDGVGWWSIDALIDGEIIAAGQFVVVP